MATIARPGPPGVPVKALPPAPNKTLYVRNLPDKLPKEDLKRNLYMLFATYGVILDIIALKTAKMRGQAHVVFRDVDAATQAMRALEGFTFFGKEMSISYAKGKSNTFAKLAGTFEIPKDITEASREKETGMEQTAAAKAVFGSAPNKAVPVNEADRAKGQKRGRDEEESEDEDAEMQMSESDSD
ncbi:RNA-binding domain-containing protein [Lentithecium fluviatile CBS 122367]|uniref:RNA-binding domain-containing protein n=1 Tax=Lentithecium fluviatile CBS 122367 TaxID=1168545 RepID=A0A6G1J394_9PLEO|nr:RNA-binding domain-containing protein [Lentithecium fluviatile CBS 122367]